jgi:hypothetical protein
MLALGKDFKLKVLMLGVAIGLLYSIHASWWQEYDYFSRLASSSLLLYIVAVVGGTLTINQLLSLAQASQSSPMFKHLGEDHAQRQSIVLIYFTIAFTAGLGCYCLLFPEFWLKLTSPTFLLSLALVVLSLLLLYLADQLLLKYSRS